MYGQWIAPSQLRLLIGKAKKEGEKESDRQNQGQETGKGE